MTNINPDPVALAHEVLQAVAEERQTALTGSTLDNSLAIEELFDAALAAAPALARAVLRVAELVDRFEAERDTSHAKDEAIAWDYAATLTDAALNGKIR